MANIEESNKEVGSESAQVKKLKILLGIADSDKDVLIGFSLKSAEEVIKNYCHIEEIPEGLSATILRIAMDIYRNEQPGSSSVPMAVQSITEGDSSTSFGTAQESVIYAETLLKNYKKQLNRYRRVIW